MGKHIFFSNMNMEFSIDQLPSSGFDHGSSSQQPIHQHRIEARDRELFGGLPGERMAASHPDRPAVCGLQHCQWSSSMALAAMLLIERLRLPGYAPPKR